jgi:hypothetical protein
MVKEEKWASARLWALKNMIFGAVPFDSLSNPDRRRTVCWWGGRFYMLIKHSSMPPLVTADIVIRAVAVSVGIGLFF